MGKPVIAIDIDDVLSATAEGFAHYSNARWGYSLTAQDYQEEWALVWGTSLEETLIRAVELHNSGIISRYRHFDDAIPVLRHLAVLYDLILVTSRRRMIRHETDAWIERHFSGLFKDIRYVGMWDTQRHEQDVANSLKATKTEICKEIGARYLIDDQLKHCASAASAGITGLLFGDYNWNRGNVPSGVIRVKNWQAVEDYFSDESR